MSLMVPEEWDWVFILIAGSNWPKGDEDRIRAIARSMYEAGDQLGTAGDEMRAALNDVVTYVGETVGRAFARYGQELVERQGYFRSTADDLGKMAEEFALQVESAKYSILVQLAFAAAEIAFIFANPVLMPYYPAFVLAVRRAVQQIMARFTAAVARLLRYAVRSPAWSNNLASVFTMMVTQAVEEGVDEVREDSIVQAVQFAENNRHVWDSQSSLDAVRWGVVAGGFSGMFGGIVNVAKPHLAHNALMSGFNEAATEAFVGGATVPEGGDPGEIWQGVINGAASGALTQRLENANRGREERAREMWENRVDGPRTDQPLPDFGDEFGLGDPLVAGDSGTAVGSDGQAAAAVSTPPMASPVVTGNTGRGTSNTAASPAGLTLRQGNVVIAAGGAGASTSNTGTLASAADTAAVGAGAASSSITGTVGQGAAATGTGPGTQFGGSAGTAGSTGAVSSPSGIEPGVGGGQQTSVSWPSATAAAGTGSAAGEVGGQHTPGSSTPPTAPANAPSSTGTGQTPGGAAETQGIASSSNGATSAGTTTLGSTGGGNAAPSGTASGSTTPAPAAIDKAVTAGAEETASSSSGALQSRTPVSAPASLATGATPVGEARGSQPGTVASTSVPAQQPSAQQPAPSPGRQPGRSLAGSAQPAVAGTFTSEPLSSRPVEAPESSLLKEAPYSETDSKLGEDIDFERDSLFEMDAESDYDTDVEPETRIYGTTVGQTLHSDALVEEESVPPNNSDLLNRLREAAGDRADEDTDILAIKAIGKLSDSLLLRAENLLVNAGSQPVLPHNDPTPQRAKALLERERQRILIAYALHLVATQCLDMAEVDRMVADFTRGRSAAWTSAPLGAGPGGADGHEAAELEQTPGAGPSRTVDPHGLESRELESIVSGIAERGTGDFSVKRLDEGPRSIAPVVEAERVGLESDDELAVWRSYERFASMPRFDLDLPAQARELGLSPGAEPRSANPATVMSPPSTVRNDQPIDAREVVDPGQERGSHLADSSATDNATISVRINPRAIAARPGAFQVPFVSSGPGQTEQTFLQLPGIDESGVIRHSALGDIEAAPMYDRSGGVVGISFHSHQMTRIQQTWLHLSEEVDEVALVAARFHPRSQGLDFLSRNEVWRRKALALKVPWGSHRSTRNFFVFTHGSLSADGRTALVRTKSGRELDISGDVLAELVLQTGLLGSQNAFNATTLVVCDAGARGDTPGGVSRDFWDRVVTRHPHMVVHAATSVIWTSNARISPYAVTVLDDGGRWISHGVISPGYEPTFDEVVDQLFGWQDKAPNLRARYQDIPLFSVVDRAVRMGDALARALEETGTLDFASVRHLAETGPAPDLVWRAAMYRLASLPNLPRLSQVLLRASGEQAVALPVQVRAAFTVLDRTRYGATATWTLASNSVFPQIGLISRSTLVRNELARRLNLDCYLDLDAVRGLVEGDGVSGIVLQSALEDLRRRDPVTLTRLAAVRRGTPAVALPAPVRAMLVLGSTPDVNGMVLARWAPDVLPNEGQLQDVSRLADQLWRDVGATGTLDLASIRAEVARTAQPDLVWSAVLARLSARPDRDRVTHVIDRYRNQSGSWVLVNLPATARSRFTVTGKGTWEADFVVRPARLVPPDVAEPLVAAAADFTPPVVRVIFAPKRKARADVRPSSELRRFTRWLVEAAIELDADGIAVPMVEIEGDGHGKFLGDSRAHGEVTGKRRAEAVREYLADNLEPMLDELTSPLAELRSREITRELLLPDDHPVSGVHNPIRSAQAGVTLRARVDLTAPTVFGPDPKVVVFRSGMTPTVEADDATDAPGVLLDVVFENDSIIVPAQSGQHAAIRQLAVEVADAAIRAVANGRPRPTVTINGFYGGVANNVTIEMSRDRTSSVEEAFLTALSDELELRRGQQVKSADIIVTTSLDVVPSDEPEANHLVRIRYDTPLPEGTSARARTVYGVDLDAVIATMADPAALAAADVRVSQGGSTATDRMAVDARRYADLVMHESTIDLSAVHPLISRDPRADMLWAAALGYLVANPDLRRTVVTIVDRYRGPNGWVHVRLPESARSRFAVIGKGTWQDSGRVVRPVRLVPPGEAQPAVVMDSSFVPGPVEFVFAGAQVSLDPVAPAEEFNRLATWLAEVAVELSGDGQSLPSLGFRGEGHDGRAVGIEQSTLKTGSRGAREVRQLLLLRVRSEVRARLSGTGVDAAAVDVEAMFPDSAVNTATGELGSRVPAKVAVYGHVDLPAAHLVERDRREVFAGIDLEGATRYFVFGQVETHEVVDTSGAVAGIGFTTAAMPGSLRAGFPTILNRETTLTPYEERHGKLKKVVAAESSTVPTAWTSAANVFYVNAHRKPGLVWLSIHDGVQPASVRVSGETLANIVLLSSAFQKRGVRVPDAFALYICSAGARTQDGGPSMPERFWRSVRETGHDITTHAPSDVLGTSKSPVGPRLITHDRTIVAGGGRWITHGAVYAEDDLDIGVILSAAKTRNTKGHDVRRHFAREMPLFSVVDRAYQVFEELDRQLCDTGVLDLDVVMSVAEIGPRPDLVWQAALELVGEGANAHRLRGVRPHPDMMDLIGDAVRATGEIKEIVGAPTLPVTWRSGSRSEHEESAEPAQFEFSARDSSFVSDGFPPARQSIFPIADGSLHEPVITGLAQEALQEDLDMVEFDVLADHVNSSALATPGTARGHDKDGEWFDVDLSTVVTRELHDRHGTPIGVLLEHESQQAANTVAWAASVDKGITGLYGAEVQHGAQTHEADRVVEAAPWTRDTGWGRTLYVAVHGLPGEVQVHLENGQQVYVSGRSLARVVLSSSVMRHASLPRAVVLVVCFAAAPHPHPGFPSVAEGFWTAMRDAGVPVHVHGATTKLTTTASPLDEVGVRRRGFTHVLAGGHWVVIGPSGVPTVSSGRHL